MRRVLKLILGLLLGCMLAVGALFASIFINKMPIEDGKVLNGHGITVDDGFSAAFILPAGDGVFALVDCTNDLHAAAMISALKARGGGPDSVRAIFLTHGHPDHIAGCSQFTKAEVYAFPEDVAMVAGNAHSTSPMGELTGVQTGKTAQVSKTLTDGQEVMVGDLSVRAFRVPGHTAGSGAYLARGVLYLGDSVKVNKDGSVSNAPWLFTEDQRQNVASVVALATRLQSEGVKVVALSHTGPLAGLQPLLLLK